MTVSDGAGWVPGRGTLPYANHCICLRIDDRALNVRLDPSVLLAMNSNVIDLAAVRTSRHQEPPASGVMRVAPPVRRHSFIDLVSPVEARRRAFRELTEAAARAYDAAAAHRAAGDEAGAALLVSAAGQALNQAAEIGEELARL